MSRIHTPASVDDSLEAKMIPSGRIDAAEDIAAGIPYLASGEASYVVGAKRAVDRGLGQI
jgi:NAD(P)-dependent dehydrogenase (short-subunit alcohol dehydrogenase family)